MRVASLQFSLKFECSDSLKLLVRFGSVGEGLAGRLIHTHFDLQLTLVQSEKC
jgi:hypothetical protein